MAMTTWKCFCIWVVLSNAARNTFNESEGIRDMAKLATGRNNEGVVIIDVGTYQIKAGLLGEALEMEHIIPPKLLRSTHQVSGQENLQHEYEKRDGADEHSLWKTTYVVKEGRPVEWEYFENLIRKVFNSLHVDPIGSSVFLVYSSTNAPKYIAEKMVTVFFETFEVGNLVIYDQAYMAMLNTGLSKSALVVNIGEDVTYAIGIYEGYMIPHSRQVSKFGSKYITDCINKKLWNRDPSKVTSARLIKEAKAKVLTDYDDTLNDFEGDTARLPDGTYQALGDEIFTCPEHLLNPQHFLIDMEAKGPGIIDIAVKAINLIDIDVREDMVKNIVITGGGANIPGLVDRLRKGIEEKLPAKYAPATVRGSYKNPHQYNAWIGAAFFADSYPDDVKWYTEEDYMELGSEGIHRRLY